MFKKLITLLVVMGLLFALVTLSSGARETLALASEPAKMLIGKTSAVTEKIGGAIGDKLSPADLIPEEAEIDWGDGVIRVTGHGALPVASQTYPQAKLMAVGAAELDAQRILAATLRGAMITSKRKLENYIQKEYIVEENVNAMIHGAQVTDVRVMPDGNVQVDMELRLKGLEQKAVVAAPEAAPAASTAVPGRLQGWRALDYYDPTSNVLGREKMFTGLIINARNLHATAALSPEIITETGIPVFPLRDEAAEGAPAGVSVAYEPSVSQAMKNPRIGSNPLILDAVATTGKLRTDLVVRDADYERLARNASAESILSEGKIVVVVD